jgi:hypothetical protein
MVPAREDAERFRRFLAEIGYTQTNLRDHLKLSELPSRRLRNHARLLDLTAEPTALHTLLRWFWVGVGIAENVGVKRVPPWVVKFCVRCGLLREEGDTLNPQVLLTSIGAFLIASDRTATVECAAPPDLVLWPNPTTRLLADFTVRKPSRATLDLGTGNGIQALYAAAHSSTVIASDLNPRAVQFAAFNARLNGCENVECLPGDMFEPVKGHSFDLIVSNPPFFISPFKRYLFCDNPMELDQLCRTIVRQAPAYLSEGGYFQMMCEWARVQGQPLEEKIEEWFTGTGCDAWVVTGHAQDPGEYADARIREMNVREGEADPRLYDQYMAYYRGKKVDAIHGGIVAMRRRSGRNWTLTQEMSKAPKKPFGGLVQQVFANRDVLDRCRRDEQLLELSPSVSAGARLEEQFQHSGSGWKPKSLMLVLDQGVRTSVEVQPLVAEFLGRCDGKRKLGELIQEMSAKVDVDVGTVRSECLKVVRELAGHCFLVFDGETQSGEATGKSEQLLPWHP